MSDYRVAFDIGGVLGDTLDERDTGDGKTFRMTRPKRGAFRAVRTTVYEMGADNVFLISRARDWRRIRANYLWLANWNFPSRTGLPLRNIFITDEPREAKGVLAAELEITHMVDDRLQCLASMPAEVACIAFGATDEDFASQVKGPLHRVPDWIDFAMQRREIFR
jgi:hypothetical protein